MRSLKQEKESTLSFFLIFLVFSLLIQFSFAYLINEELDIINYNLVWATSKVDSIATMYQDIDILNYPPIFPLLLRLINPFMTGFSEGHIPRLIFVALKFWPIVFNELLSISVYVLAKKNKLFWACFCLFNPAFIMNAAICFHYF